MKKFLPKTKYSPNGFTLIELMVTISIIAILSVIGMTVYTGVQKNSRDAKRKADISSIANALESDFASNDRTAYQTPTTAMFSGSAIPVDPGTYTYTYTQLGGAALPGATYCTCAQLETVTAGNSGAACAAGATTYYCRKNQQ